MEVRIMSELSGALRWGCNNVQSPLPQFGFSVPAAELDAPLKGILGGLRS